MKLIFLTPWVVNTHGTRRPGVHTSTSHRTSHDMLPRTPFRRVALWVRRSFATCPATALARSATCAGARSSSTCPPFRRGRKPATRPSQGQGQPVGSPVALRGPMPGTRALHPRCVEDASRRKNRRGGHCVTAFMSGCSAGADMCCTSQ